MKDHVDILLATYRGERYLSEQIQSILAQTHPYIRLLARDDASDDKTPSILQEFAERYPDKIQILPSIKNLGIRGNFSELMKHSTADYMLFADQDDKWHPTKVEDSLKFLKEMERKYGKETPLLAHSDLSVVNGNLELISSSFWHYSYLNPHLDALNRLLAQNVVTGCATIFNRALCKVAWPIPDEAVMHDWWMALVAKAFGQIEPLPIPTILYRQHSSNDTGAKKYGLADVFNAKKWQSSASKSYKQADAFLKRFGDHLEANQRNLVSIYASLGKACFLERKIQIWKCGFFKQGLLRNIKAFFLN